MPPLGDGVSGEGRRVVGDADKHRAEVGCHIVDAKRKSHPNCIGAEVMVIDVYRCKIPFSAIVLEVSDEFPLFRIDADDGKTHRPYTDL